MPPVSTPNQRLAERIIGRPLGEYVTEKRTAIPKWSWRLIARQIEIDTGGQVNVTDETLRGWFVDTDDTESAA